MAIDSTNPWFSAYNRASGGFNLANMAGWAQDPQQQMLQQLMMQASRSGSNPYLSQYSFNPMQFDPSLSVSGNAGGQRINMGAGTNLQTNPEYTSGRAGIPQGSQSMSPWLQYGLPLLALGGSSAGGYFAGQNSRDAYKTQLGMLNRSGSYTPKDRERQLRETRDRVRGQTAERGSGYGSPAGIWAEEGILSNVAKNFDELALQHYLAKAQLMQQQPNQSQQWMDQGSQAMMQLLPLLMMA